MRTANPAFLGFNVSYFNDLGRFGITEHHIFWAVWVSLCSSDFSKSPYQPLFSFLFFLFPGFTSFGPPTNPGAPTTTLYGAGPTWRILSRRTDLAYPFNGITCMSSRQQPPKSRQPRGPTNRSPRAAVAPLAKDRDRSQRRSGTARSSGTTP